MDLLHGLMLLALQVKRRVQAACPLGRRGFFSKPKILVGLFQSTASSCPFRRFAHGQKIIHFTALLLRCVASRSLSASQKHGIEVALGNEGEKPVRWQKNTPAPGSPREIHPPVGVCAEEQARSASVLICPPDRDRPAKNHGKTFVLPVAWQCADFTLPGTLRRPARFRRGA